MAKARLLQQWHAPAHLLRVKPGHALVADEFDPDRCSKARQFKRMEKSR